MKVMSKVDLKSIANKKNYHVSPLVCYKGVIALEYNETIYTVLRDAKATHIM